MPLLASSCVLALCTTTAAGGEVLPREFRRADATHWSASRESALSPVGLKASSGVFHASLPAPYGVAAFSLKANETAGAPRIARLDTTWTAALPGQRDTLRLGDSLTDAGTSGRPVRFGGLHYGTNLGAGTGFVAQPAWPAARSHLIAAPGRAPYTLPSIPDGEPPVVHTLRAAPTLLRPGLVDRTFAAGRLRSNYGLEDDRYGPVFASTAFRRGISDGITAELHGAVQRRAGNGGIAFLVRPSGLGLLTVATAASRSDAGIGGLAQTGFEYRRAGFSTSISAQWSSAEFRRLGAGVESVAPRYSTVASATYDATRHCALAVAYGTLAHYNEALRKTVEGTYRVALGRASTLTFGASRAFGPEPAMTLMLTFTVPLDAVPITSKAGGWKGTWTFDRSPELTSLARLSSDRS